MDELEVVIIWMNGTVTAFDGSGHQVPECQGDFRDVSQKLVARKTSSTKFFFGGLAPAVLLPLDQYALHRMTPPVQL